MARKFFGVLCVLMGFLLFSCASNKEQVKDPNFLGDYDPIKLEPAMGWVPSFGSEKPKEIDLYFIPRTNRVEIHFRDFQNQVCVILSPEHRQLMIDAATEFMASQEQGQLPNRKANSKNYYSESKCSVGWGVLGLSRVTESSRLQFNYEYFSDGRPYFLLRALPGPDKTDSTVYSPTIRAFFSPTQLEALYEILNQDALQALIDELNTKAFVY